MIVTYDFNYSEQKYTFEYSGSPLEVYFFKGKYLLELYGASGSGEHPGKGGYSCGILHLLEPITLYLYIGGEGKYNPNNDEYKLIETIARAIFNLRMSDFTDEIMSCYVHDLKVVVDEIKSYDEKLANSRNSANGYKIIFTDENGHEITRQFDATEYTDSGQLLYNDITTALDEFGGAVSSDEKRQILFRILKEVV